MKEEKKERKEEKLMKEPPLCKLSLSKYYSCSTILLDISISPQENSNFKNPNFLEKISFQSSRFLKSIQ